MDTNIYAGLSDTELDAAYAAYFDAHDMVDAAVIGDEIIQRLASVLSFTEGLFGVNRFPLYTARTEGKTGFNQVATAQSSVATSASHVGSAIKSGVTSIASKLGVGFGAVVGVAVLGVAVFLYIKTTKK